MSVILFIMLHYVITNIQFLIAIFEIGLWQIRCFLNIFFNDFGTLHISVVIIIYLHLEKILILSFLLSNSPNAACEYSITLLLQPLNAVYDLSDELTTVYFQYHDGHRLSVYISGGVKANAVKKEICHSGNSLIAFEYSSFMYNYNHIWNIKSPVSGYIYMKIKHSNYTVKFRNI